MLLRVSQDSQEKNLCCSLSIRKLQAFNLIKKRLQHRCFPVNVANFLRTPILKNICKRLLLKTQAIFHKEWYSYVFVFSVNVIWVFQFIIIFSKSISKKHFPTNLGLKCFSIEQPSVHPWTNLFIHELVITWRSNCMTFASNKASTTSKTAFGGPRCKFKM